MRNAFVAPRMLIPSRAISNCPWAPALRCAHSPLSRGILKVAQLFKQSEGRLSQLSMHDCTAGDNQNMLSPTRHSPCLRCSKQTAAAGGCQSRRYPPCPKPCTTCIHVSVKQLRDVSTVVEQQGSHRAAVTCRCPAYGDCSKSWWYWLYLQWRPSFRSSSPWQSLH